jgi:hypothetical protein
MKLIPVTVFATAILLCFPVHAANGVSVQLSVDQSDIDSALATARTPQEAARLFAKLVTPAIGQAVAEALQQMLARTEGATDNASNSITQDFLRTTNGAIRLGATESNGLNATEDNADPPSPIEGWPNIVLQNGLLMELHWPSPGLAASGNLPVVVVQAPNAVVSSQGPLTISVSGTF